MKGHLKHLRLSLYYFTESPLGVNPGYTQNLRESGNIFAQNLYICWKWLLASCTHLHSSLILSLCFVGRTVGDHLALPSSIIIQLCGTRHHRDDSVAGVGFARLMEPSGRRTTWLILLPSTSQTKPHPYQIWNVENYTSFLGDIQSLFLPTCWWSTKFKLLNHRKMIKTSNLHVLWEVLTLSRQAMNDSERQNLVIATVNINKH